MLVISAVPGTAYACPGSVKQDLATYNKADVVLRARVTSYEYREAQHDARMDFEVVEYLGPRWPRTAWQATWRHSTFGMRREWGGPKQVIVGFKAVLDAEGQPALEVVQQGCSSPTMVEDTPANVQLVKSYLRWSFGADHKLQKTAPDPK